ncbi:MAG: MFS transporter [Myxococcales bacterium]|nr:MFS transporter [Myxococcales bacterium]
MARRRGMSATSVPFVTRRLAVLTEGLTAPFWALWIGTLITKAGAFVVPMLFVYLTQARGLPLTVAGAVAALYGFGSLLGTVAGGVLADHLGRRVTMLLSLVSGAVFMVALGFATELWHLAPCTFLLGLTADAYRPASQALVADIVPAQHRLKAFTLQYWAINLGFSFAALVAGYMAKRNFTLLFLGDAATTLVLAGIIFARVPESRPQPRPRAQAQGSVFTPFADRVFLPFVLLNFGVVLIFFQHLTGLPEDMRTKGLSTQEFGMAVATNGVLIVLLQPFLTRWAAQVRRSTLLAIAAALTGLGFGLTHLASTLPLFMISVAVWTLGEIIFAPVNASLVADLSPAHLRGRYQGAFGVTWSLGAMLGPVAGPALIEATSLKTLWVTCLAAGLAIAFVHLTVSSRVLPAASPAAESS